MMYRNLINSAFRKCSMKENTTCGERNKAGLLQALIFSWLNDEHCAKPEQCREPWGKVSPKDSMRWGQGLQPTLPYQSRINLASWLNVGAGRLKLFFRATACISPQGSTKGTRCQTSSSPAVFFLGGDLHFTPFWLGYFQTAQFPALAVLFPLQTGCPRTTASFLFRDLTEWLSTV